ncbi:MAG TPA: LPS export ABC transporter permease LptG [Thermoanaerobaculia bacterium]|nr:LPS export ABC transporter permease LptG [Thermoanaerobaculia bacterium]
MNTLTRYVLKEMLGPTLLGFAFYTSIILMRQLFDWAGMIIRQSLAAATVVKLLGLSLPHIVVLTVPMSLLFGILIAIGRLSSDSEIIAMRALGISTRTIYRPVFLFSFVVFLLNLYLMLVVVPRGNKQLKNLFAEIATSSAEKEIKPRIFYDEYENLTIYVNDIDARTGEWRGVFVADARSAPDEPSTPADVTAAAASRERPIEGALAQYSGHRITIAERGNLSVVRPGRQIWLNLRHAQTHVWDPARPERYDVNQNASQRVLLADRFSVDAGRLAPSLRELNLRELLTQADRLRSGRDRETYNLARVEIHKKFAIPFACIAFGVIGLPLGITNRRGGKSSGFSLSIAIILVYYLMINNGEALARAGRIPPWVAMWAPNLAMLAVGTYLLGRANRDTGAQATRAGWIRRMAAAFVSGIRRRDAAPVEDEPAILRRLDVAFPNILDRYILREFLKVLALVLVSTAALIIIVDYTETARDIRQNDVPLPVVFSYYRYLIFQVINWTLPISVLVATLVTFGIFSKNNEVTAFKSGGVSLYRVSLPVVLVAAVISLLVYLNLDFVLPYANQRVDQLKRRIQGKEMSTPAEQKLWFVGKGRYLINFLSYDRARRELAHVQIFEFHPTEFRLTRRLFARTARWNGEAWVFENGWIRSFPDGGYATYTPITRPVVLAYGETPEDFATEVKSPEQMTFAELRRYIRVVRNSGYSAERLMVKLYEKTSWPAISIVMALIALPFAFRIGKRGALYGIGIALILGIVYWMVFAIFTKFGEVGNLPPILSAWSANILFAIAAVYLFLHVET